MITLKQFLYTLSPISDLTWQRIEPLFTETRLEKGDYFIEEGQLATQFAFVQSGVIRGFYRDPQGTEYNKHFFVSPSIVGGYTSLITGKPNQISQQALTDCELLQANYQMFTALYDTYPELERVGRRFAEQYFVEKEQKEIEIVLLDAESRYRLFQEKYPELEQQIPQYHIASYLGITPTQLSRIRKKWSQS
ncbi:cyclic nucleotide-binding domain-containing protein [Spirosoma sp. HMF4905]|uniref:Cyclic nucleotide-binding domain-containing protein n=1 Tax=Spirosoma arboris TaxID=2682092 RepID=A0A7K1SC50_9BACT|nr:Crp/Fnr family transcriptional regulator [Spirosoma arboris]MVM31360.1 cyclic nucleotide-binding domain-containing protein [Spirosoma arboris]